MAAWRVEGEDEEDEANTNGTSSVHIGRGAKRNGFQSNHALQGVGHWPEQTRDKNGWLPPPLVLSLLPATGTGMKIRGSNNCVDRMGLSLSAGMGWAKDK